MAFITARVETTDEIRGLHVALAKSAQASEDCKHRHKNTLQMSKKRSLSTHSVLAGQLDMEFGDDEDTAEQNLIKWAFKTLEGPGHYRD